MTSSFQWYKKTQCVDFFQFAMTTPAEEGQAPFSVSQEDSLKKIVLFLKELPPVQYKGLKVLVDKLQSDDDAKKAAQRERSKPYIVRALQSSRK